MKGSEEVGSFKCSLSFFGGNGRKRLEREKGNWGSGVWSGLSAFVFFFFFFGVGGGGGGGARCWLGVGGLVWFLHLGITIERTEAHTS